MAQPHLPPQQGLVERVPLEMRMRLQEALLEGGLVPRLDGLDVQDGDSVNFIVVLKCNSKLLHVLLILYT